LLHEDYQQKNPLLLQETASGIQTGNDIPAYGKILFDAFPMICFEFVSKNYCK